MSSINTPTPPVGHRLYDDKHSGSSGSTGPRAADLPAPGRRERILDLGCGTGHLTAQIAASGPRSSASIPHPRWSGRPGRLYPPSALNSSMPGTSRFPGAFDGVFSTRAPLDQEPEQPSPVCGGCSGRAGGSWRVRRSRECQGDRRRTQECGGRSASGIGNTPGTTPASGSMLRYWNEPGWR
jgi:hypothetical protein